MLIVIFLLKVEEGGEIESSISEGRLNLDFLTVI
jgi:hypothetical protein